MECLVSGVVERSGKAKSTGQPYKFAQLLVLVPVEPVVRDTFAIRGAGYELRELDCSPEAFQSALALKFPSRCELTLEVEMRRSGPQTIVSRVNVAPVASRAA